MAAGEDAVIVLLIDVCGTVGSVALGNTLDGTLMAAVELPGRSASEQLVATVRELLAGAGVASGAIGVVGVVKGPGSFTGVRVGLSAAKGLCEAWGVPMIAVSRLAVLASLMARERVCALMDAGRGEYYLGVYAGEECLREALGSREEVLREHGAKATYETAVAAAFVEAEVCVVPEPLAGTALGWVMRRLEAGDFDDVATIDANYVRRTDAEIFAKPRGAEAGVGSKAISV